MDFQPELTLLPPVAFVVPINEASGDADKAKSANEPSSTPDTKSFGTATREPYMYNFVQRDTISFSSNQSSPEQSDDLVSDRDDSLASDAVFAGDLWSI